MTTGNATNVVQMSRAGTSCENCCLNRFCLANGLKTEQMQMLNRLTRQSRPFNRGSTIFRAGEELEALYVIRSGAVKIFTSAPDGVDQIIRFHLPGDLIGLDAMGHHRHTTTAVALDTTSVCIIPWSAINSERSPLPILQSQVLRIVGTELATENERMIMLAQRAALERLAAFLVHLSEQFRRRGFSATEFNLSMSRQEIANYLGLAIETVSRLFSQLQADDLIEVSRRFVRIRQPEALRELAYGEDQTRRAAV